MVTLQKIGKRKEVSHFTEDRKEEGRYALPTVFNYIFK